MSILSDLQITLKALDIPIETGTFSDNAPSEYLVLVPMNDVFEIHADNSPHIDIQEVRISLYSKGNYIKMKNAVLKALFDDDFTITSRQYIGYETETGYHHYNVDVAKHYEIGGN